MFNLVDHFTNLCKTYFVLFGRKLFIFAQKSILVKIGFKFWEEKNSGVLVAQNAIVFNNMQVYLFILA